MQGKLESYKGIITPSTWDSNGNVLKVHIALEGEVNMQLEQNNKSSELNEFSGAVVSLLGWWTDTSVFVVKEYKIVKFYQKENYENF